MGQCRSPQGKWTEALPYVVPFILIGIYLILKVGSITIGRYEIWYESTLSRHKMAWSEVTRISLASTERVLVFHGADKRLAIPGPHYWTDGHVKAALDLMEQQIRAHHIEVEETLKADYMTSKNTRV